MVRTESAELCWEPITTKYVNQIMAGGDGELFIVKECGKTEHVDNGNDLPIIEENTFSEDNYTYRRVKKIESGLRQPRWSMYGWMDRDLSQN